MKLIVVDRNKLQTFQRLTCQFAGARDVKVVLDRRVKQIRKRKVDGHYPERRESERRRLVKLEGRDYTRALASIASTPQPRVTTTVDSLPEPWTRWPFTRVLRFWIRPQPAVVRLRTGS